LRQYLLAASERIETELRPRQGDGQWLLRFASKVEEGIDLASVARAGYSRQFIQALN
jgi:hypothetical protein